VGRVRGAWRSALYERKSGRRFGRKLNHNPIHNVGRIPARVTSRLFLACGRAQRRGASRAVALDRLAETGLRPKAG
jgi:hypothetical protein